MEHPSELMKRVRILFEKSGLTLEELGTRMGANTNARMSAWQFLRKTVDPRLSMLFRFCEAFGIEFDDLNSEWDLDFFLEDFEAPVVKRRDGVAERKRQLNRAAAELEELTERLRQIETNKTEGRDKICEHLKTVANFVRRL
jgi:transcriptional regulator with XRE-family HTH domain